MILAKAGNLSELAAGYLAGGLSLVPTSAQTKRPDPELLPRDEAAKPGWKVYQERPADAATVKSWFARGCTSVAAIGGRVSGGLLVIDFDVARFYDAWCEQVGSLAEGLPVQRTGREGGGFQVWLRCPEPGHNDRLAYVADESEESGRRVAIETRAEGGYAVAPGSLHPSGRRYEVVAGVFANIPSIPQVQADALLAAARRLDEAPHTRQEMERREAAAKACPAYRGESNGQGSVIAAYNERIVIEEALESHGYIRAGQRWKRPGGASPSVTVNEGRSFHHSSNDTLSDGYWHRPFDLFCHYQHGGDCKAAVRGAAEVLGLAIGGPNGREIEIGTDEPRVIDEAIEALATCENVYQRGGGLVQVVQGAEAPRGIARPKDAPRIAPLRHARIRELLADAAAWFRPDGDDGERERIHPPDWTVKAVDARGQWPGIRRLEAVVESPILRADGTVLQIPGYDPSTGLLFQPSDTFPSAPDRPTQADARQAVQHLLEVVEDFPFSTEAHRAAWVASTITPLARYAFHGTAPLFLVDANVRGCGKSLLTDATSQTVAGREMARMSLPRDDDEFRKRITALAVAGEPLILIDNIVGTLGSASLDAALTATSWSDRILGQTAMASGVPLFATWFATGNNVILAADTARRTLHIRLESPEENPEQRSGFRHPDLLAWVRTERPRLATAAVTILAAYCAAGRPDMGLTPWGSFEAWSALVRQALVWAGLPDPAATRTELTSQADREAAALRGLIAGWEEIDPSGSGLTIGTILEELGEHQHHYANLRAALWELAPPRDGKALNPRSIGMKLHHLRRRVIGGKFLDSRDSHGTAVWFVGGQADFGRRGTSGTSWTIPSPTRAHGHARARENLEATGDSPTSPPSPTADPADCFHENVVETPTHDGYFNRQCRDCGAFLTCRKQEEPV